MRILTIGDSWTIANPSVVSWPTQMAQKYSVEVVNLARAGSSNNRAARIGIEELARDSNYDYVIFPLAPASRTEILNKGKWHQIWPTDSKQNAEDHINRTFTEIWHPFNDVQNTIMLSFNFMHSVKALGIPLYMTGLSLMPTQYTRELSWITNYQHDNNFNAVGIPNKELDIGIKDLDRKLRSLQAIHDLNLQTQPDYLVDVVHTYLIKTATKIKYRYDYQGFNHHPDTNGYAALCDYFAEKIGLI
jgi:hypothetical protein